MLVFGLGRLAEVIAPPELVQAVLADAEAIVQYLTNAKGNLKIT